MATPDTTGWNGCCSHLVVAHNGRVEGEQPKLIRGGPMLIGAAVGVVIVVIAKLVVGREHMGTFVVAGLVTLALILAFWGYSWWYVTRTERGRAAWAAHAAGKR